MSLSSMTGEGVGNHEGWKPVRFSFLPRLNPYGKSDRHGTKGVSE